MAENDAKRQVFEFLRSWSTIFSAVWGALPTSSFRCVVFEAEEGVKTYGVMVFMISKNSGAGAPSGSIGTMCSLK
jgi:hypothetical protein